MYLKPHLHRLLQVGADGRGRLKPEIYLSISAFFTFVASYIYKAVNI